jgi:hypothetical protein
MIRWIRRKLHEWFGIVELIVRKGQHVALVRGHYPSVLVMSGGLVELCNDVTLGGYQVEDGGGIVIETAPDGISGRGN